MQSMRYASATCGARKRQKSAISPFPQGDSELKYSRPEVSSMVHCKHCGQPFRRSPFRPTSDCCPQCQRAINPGPLTPTPIEPERANSRVLWFAVVLALWAGMQLVSHRDGFVSRRARGISAYTACDYSRAVSELETAVRERPEDAYAQAVLGEAYLQLYQYSNAEIPLRRAVAISPNYAYAEQALAYDLTMKGGITSYGAGRYEDAVSNLEAAAHTRPTDTYVQVYLGDAYSQLREYDHAETVYQQALVYCPRYSYARLALASIYARTDRDPA